MFYDAGQNIDRLPIFLEEVGFVFLLSTGFYVHISRYIYIFLNHVQVHKCGIHIHNFSTNWMWRVYQSLFENTCFMLLKKPFYVVCGVNVCESSQFVSCVNVVSYVVLTMTFRRRAF